MSKHLHSSGAVTPKIEAAAELIERQARQLDVSPDELARSLGMVIKTLLPTDDEREHARVTYQQELVGKKDGVVPPINNARYEELKQSSADHAAAAFVLGQVLSAAEYLGASFADANAASEPKTPEEAVSSDRAPIQPTAQDAASAASTEREAA